MRSSSLSRHCARIWLLSTATLSCASEPPRASSPVTAQNVAVSPPAKSASASAFYSQRLDDGAIPILAHASVTARGMEAARDRLELVLKNAPRIRRNLENGYYELHVIALAQMPSDLPEYQSKKGTSLPNGQAFDWHMIGGHVSESAGHYSSCTEGTLLPIVGHRLFADETCIHELGHVVDMFALGAEVRARIIEEFHASISSGHFEGKYAGTAANEWFAEVTKYYFRPDRPDLASYNKDLTQGHDWLCGYDARACAFARDLYTDKIDPGAPKTVRVEPTSGASESATKSREARMPSRLIIRNHSQQTIHAVWIDYEGKRDPRTTFDKQKKAAPGEEIAQSTFASHAFVVTDDQERALCVVTAQESETIIDVTGACP